MKIAFFTNNYLPNVYGVPMSVETFRKEFESLGHEVFIFAPNYSDYQDANNKVFRYPSLDINIKFRFPLPIPYSCKINKILKNLSIDIIHSQHPNLLGSAAAKWAKKKNIPLVFTWHTLYDRYTNFVPFIPRKLVAKWAINNAVKYANKADIVIVPTESIMPIVRKWNVKNKVVPVATGVVEEEFLNADRNKIRKKFEIKDDETLLLSVSRLTEEKNINFLFNATIEILRENKSTKLILVGDGYLITQFKKRTERENLKKRIIFAGIVDRKELKNYYAAGDIFIYASKSETQGMIITEAMYSGLPIVAVKASGVESLIEDDTNGILVTENQNEFVLAVKKLIENKELQNKMSEESKKIASNKYVSKICAVKMLEAYEKAIKNHVK